MPATTSMINTLLNYNFGSTAYTSTSPLWFGLSTTLVGPTGAVTEPGSGYLRSPITTGYLNNTDKWTTSVAANLSNKIAISFPQSSGIWGGATGILSVFIATSGTTGAGTVIWYSTLNPAILVPNNTTVTFAIGSIIITLTAVATTATLNNILNYNFGSQAYSPALPATMYFGLSTTAIDATGLATSTEPLVASGYARVSFTNNKTNWSVSSAATLHNHVAATFGETTASWGAILSVFIADSLARATGNIIWYKNLTTSFIVQDNTVVSLPIDAVVVTMT